MSNGVAVAAMEKPFDVKNLADRLKAQGIPMAEDMIQKAAKEIFAWTGESCALKGGLFAMAVPLVPILASEVDKLADKIDGVQGQ